MGIVIDSNGVINVAASTPGTYRITYTLAGTCPSSSFQDVTINAAPTVAISGTLFYCAGPGSNTTLNATAGLSSYLWSSGETTQSITATAGSYTVTGTDANGCSATSSSVTVTEIPLDNADFAYSANSYEPTDADPTPTITGLTGGTFSGTTGLVINSTTGEIDLSASTVASHTVTYNTSSSGSSVCPNTSTQNVEIAVAGIANNYSMNFDSASSDYIETTNFSALSGLSEASLSLWFKTNLSQNGKCIFSIPKNTNEQLFSLYLNTTSLTSYITTSTGLKATISSSITISNNQWHHIAVTYNGSYHKIYFNNVEVATLSATGTISSSTVNTIQIGRYGPQYSNYVSGKIDEVAIWNTALTDGTGGTVNQIAEIYNATSTNLTKDLTTVSGSNLVYWNRMGD